MKKIIQTIFIFFISINSFAQVVKLNEVSEFGIRNVEAIVVDDFVEGYFSFYVKEKYDKKSNNCVILIYDINLNKKFQIDLILNNDARFIKSSYNKEAFCFSFISERKNKIDYFIYDKSGTLNGIYTSPKLSNIEKSQLLNKSKNNTNKYYGELIAIKNDGFIRFGLDSITGKSSTIEFIDNYAKKRWSKSIEKPKYAQNILNYPIACFENILVNYQQSTRQEYYNLYLENQNVSFINTDDGSKIFDFDCKREYFNLTPTGANFFNDTILLFGEYYSKSFNFYSDDAIGIFIFMLDKNGKVLKENYMKFSDDIGKIISEISFGRMVLNSRILIQKIVRTSDNKLFAICEQYSRELNSVGSVLMGASSSSIYLLDILILPVDSNCQLLKGNIFEKYRRQVSLGSISNYLGLTSIAWTLRDYGFFDYLFTTFNKDKKTFTSTFFNYDKKMQQYVVDNVSLSKNNELFEDKLIIDIKTNYYKILPAKFGYIAILEYFSDSKILNIRLEKLNF